MAASAVHSLKRHLLLRRLHLRVRYTIAPHQSLADKYYSMDTGIIGPVTVMQKYTEEFGTTSAIVHGLIVSAILIPAALSAFAAGRVADAIGRAKAITFGGLIFGLGAALEAGAVHLGMFITGRVIEGFGEGLFLGNLVV